MTTVQRDFGDIAPPASEIVRTDAVEILPRDDFDRDVWCVLGVPIDIADLPRAVAAIETAARDRLPLSFVTPNVNWLIRALKNPESRREVLNADLSLADGAPLVMMCRLLGAPQKSRVAGSDVFEALRARPGFAGRRLKVFFFGGRDGSAEAACAALNAERGGVEAVGWINPGFGDVESMSGDEVIGAINEADPDFVVAALGAAKGQAWIERNCARLTAPVVAHLGAVVDFTSGSIARAPQWVRRIGAEWAWRIGAEPSLWRRYFDDAVSLAGLGLTRLAPQLLSGRGAAALAAPHVELLREGGDLIIRLGGDLVSTRLDDVRRTFRQAAQAGGAVSLDFTAATRIDRSFLGLVLMLEKHLARQGRALRVNGLSRRMAALFKANAMHYPPDPAPRGVKLAGAERAATG